MISIEWRPFGDVICTAKTSIRVIEGSSDDRRCAARLEELGLRPYLGMNAMESFGQVTDGGRWSAQLINMEKVATDYPDSRYGRLICAVLLACMRTSGIQGIRTSDIDQDLKARVVALADRGMNGRPDPRLLYAYALFLADSQPERAIACIRRASQLKPDPVVLERMSMLMRKLTPDEDPAGGQDT